MGYSLATPIVGYSFATPTSRAILASQLSTRWETKRLQAVFHLLLLSTQIHFRGVRSLGFQRKFGGYKG